MVQQHSARRMHWELRLETEGVLASWAVPKGPTFDAAEKRLAVRTEDHPLAYADFEGVIPEGNYGAGAMIVWDRGRYRSIDGHTPAEGLESGKLDLVLDGHKLVGRFALVRTKRGEGKDWLLLRKGEPPGDVIEPVESWPESVYSGLTVEELRDSVSRDREIAREAKARKAVRRDLDPKGAPFMDVVTIARHIHKLLSRLEVQAFVKTSGQDGLHVLLPLGGKIDHGDAKALGEILARTVCAELPEIATITRPIAKRGGKVYVDFLQNGRGKLIASLVAELERAKS